MADRRNPSPLDRIVGQRLRAARELRKLSQERLGEMLGVSFQQIQKYEKGTNGSPRRGSTRSPRSSAFRSSSSTRAAAGPTTRATRSRCCGPSSRLRIRRSGGSSRRWRARSPITRRRPFPPRPRRRRERSRRTARAGAEAHAAKARFTGLSAARRLSISSDGSNRRSTESSSLGYCVTVAG
jgi:DNA-binding XRE family transcriptional regulator